MKARGRPPPGFSWILPLLLLLPPLCNLSWDLYRNHYSSALAGSEPAGSRISLNAGTDSDNLDRISKDRERQLQWERDREGQRLQVWRELFPRYKPLAADVIHLADPSPRRNAFWIWARDLREVVPDTPVVHPDVQNLIGRVDRIWPDLGIARVQTLRDPYFRVRFRYREAWGFLWGKGTVDSRGRPLLEIRHMGLEVAFQDDETVFTDGDDGVYPGGISIGTLFRSNPLKSSFQVRGVFCLDKISRVMLLVDRARLEVRSGLGREDE